MIEAESPTELQVGRDKVLIYETKVVILAARAMDWPLREFCRPPIYFKDCKFYLRGKSKAEPPYAMRYELWVWPEEVHDQSSQPVYYDEQYVRQRDAAFRTERGREFIRPILLTFYPLLGFFWSNFKERHLTTYGIDVISATRASVTMGFLFCLLEGVFTGWLRGGFLAMVLGNGDLISVDWFLLIGLGLDCIFRCNQLLRGDVQYPWGFFEWLIPWRKKL